MNNAEFHGPVDPRKALALRIFTDGPIPTVRVSSAQARGAAKGYAYYGAARYEIRLTKRDGYPANIAQERASSDRRSLRLAKDDADKIAEREGRICAQTIGQLDRA